MAINYMDIFLLTDIHGTGINEKNWSLRYATRLDHPFVRPRV